MYPTTIVRQSGTYTLILRASVAQTIQIGRLGELHIQPGYYIYVGSAFGPGGLAARVGRHLRKEKTLRWHIDYLRARVRVGRSVVGRVILCGGIVKVRVKDADWCETGAAEGLGSSDCGCESHLVWVATRRIEHIGVTIDCESG